MQENFNCPLRTITIGNDMDHWRSNMECSLCGSIHPELALALAGKGAAVKDEGEKFLVQAEDGQWRPVLLHHLTAEEKKDLQLRSTDTVLEERTKAAGTPRRLKAAAQPAEDTPKE